MKYFLLKNMNQLKYLLLYETFKEGLFSVGVPKMKLNF